MSRAAGVLLAIVLALVSRRGEAHASEPAPGAPLTLPLEGELTSIGWRTPPSNEDLQREYPRLAQLLELDGGATITCQAEVDGRVDECHVVSEWPSGLGFGAAAVRSAAYFTMKPATRDGKPVIGSVTIPLNFKLSGGERAAEPDPVAAPTSASALLQARRIIALEDVAERYRRQWRTALDQMAAEGVIGGQAQSSQTAIDALRQALEEMILKEVNRRAEGLAAHMSETQLRAIAAYLQTPTGQAWIRAEKQDDEATPKDLSRRLAQAARTHLCSQINCNAPSKSPTSAADR